MVRFFELWLSALISYHGTGKKYRFKRETIEVLFKKKLCQFLVLYEQLKLVLVPHSLSQKGILVLFSFLILHDLLHYVVMNQYFHFSILFVYRFQIFFFLSEERILSFTFLKTWNSFPTIVFFFWGIRSKLRSLKTKAFLPDTGLKSLVQNYYFENRVGTFSYSQVMLILLQQAL